MTWRQVVLIGRQAREVIEILANPKRSEALSNKEAILECIVLLTWQIAVFDPRPTFHKLSPLEMI